MSRASNDKGQPVDYDSIAPAYDRRYEDNEYSGIDHALLRFVDAAPGTHVLEVGCGTGHWLGVLGRHGIRALGVDASRAMLARARAHAAVVQGRAEHLPCAEASFDRVVCINALHHFSDPPGFLAEARRVLRANGAVMTVGLDPHTRLDRWCIYDYFAGTRESDELRYPASGTIRAWMAAAGFKDCSTFAVQHLQFRLPGRDALAQGRLDKTVTSQLSLLSDAEYERGLERIREEIRDAEARGTSFDLTTDLRLYATVGIRN